MRSYFLNEVDKENEEWEMEDYSEAEQATGAAKESFQKHKVRKCGACNESFDRY